MQLNETGLFDVTFNLASAAKNKHNIKETALYHET